MQCNRCNTIVTDEYWTEHKDEKYCLCNECSKELLQDAQSATEGDELC